jgi:UDP-glucose 4-epimerase
MNILILGGSGFIGSNLVERLSNSKHNIKVLLHNGISKNIKTFNNIEYFFSDFSNIRNIPKMFDDVDLVINLITTTQPSNSNADKIYDIESNLINNIKLLDLMRTYSIPKIIYASSGGAIYGTSFTDKIKEDNSLHPISSYGIVKIAIESYLRLYNRLYGIDYLILRISNPYGNLNAKIGIHGIISTIFSKILSNESIEIWGDGTIVRDYIYIDDLIDAIELGIEKNIFGTYNIGSGIGYSIIEAIRVIENIVGKSLDIKFCPSRNMDIERVVLDITRFQSVSGWNPKTSLDDGCRKHYKQLKELLS